MEQLLRNEPLAKQFDVYAKPHEKLTIWIWLVKSFIQVYSYVYDYMTFIWSPTRLSIAPAVFNIPHVKEKSRSLELAMMREIEGFISLMDMPDPSDLMQENRCHLKQCIINASVPKGTSDWRSMSGLRIMWWVLLYGREVLCQSYMGQCLYCFSSKWLILHLQFAFN